MNSFNITLYNYQDYLPDDIINHIYSKIIYRQPIELLNQIKYRYKIKKFINIFKLKNINNKYLIFYEILIVYYSLINNFDYKYIYYDQSYIPNNLLTKIAQFIGNNLESNNKINKICIKYLLEIPYCHIKYIFKPNRERIFV